MADTNRDPQAAANNPNDNEDKNADERTEAEKAGAGTQAEPGAVAPNTGVGTLNGGAPGTNAPGQ